MLWSLVSGSFGTCGEAGASDQVAGALGTLDYSEGGTMCMRGVASLHVTLFAFSSSGETKTARLDFDQIATNLYYNSDFCQ